MIAEFKILLIAMSPILELRGSIPIALGVYQMPFWSSFLISIVGNLIPVLLLLWLLEAVSKYLSSHFYFFNRFFTWLFERARRKHTDKFERWKEYALVVLVAIPLPFTGAWTGSLCAFVFGIPFKKAFPLISIGVVIAAVIVTLTTLSIFIVI